MLQFIDWVANQKLYFRLVYLDNYNSLFYILITIEM
jgi:hypothetical protein